MMKRASILFLIIAALPALAHDFHASLAEVEWKSHEKKIEVSLRLFPDDVEKALSRVARRGVKLEARDAEAALKRYVNAHFVFSDGERRSLFKVVGLKTNVDSMWLFLESDWQGGTFDEVRVENSLLAEIYSDQVNLVNLRSSTSKRTLMFDASNTRRQVRH